MKPAQKFLCRSNWPKLYRVVAPGCGTIAGAARALDNRFFTRNARPNSRLLSVRGGRTRIENQRGWPSASWAAARWSRSTRPRTILATRRPFPGVIGSITVRRDRLPPLFAWFYTESPRGQDYVTTNWLRRPHRRPPRRGDPTRSSSDSSMDWRTTARVPDCCTPGPTLGGHSKPVSRRTSRPRLPGSWSMSTKVVLRRGADLHVSGGFTLGVESARGTPQAARGDRIRIVQLRRA